MDDCEHKYNLVTTIKKEIFKKNFFRETKETEEKAVLLCEKCKTEKIIGFE